MLKLIKIMNSSSSVPELTRFYGQIGKVYAHSAYFVKSDGLYQNCDFIGQQVFIPIHDTDSKATWVDGYYVTPDMVFETDYIIGVEDECFTGDPVAFETVDNRGNSAIGSSYTDLEYFCGGPYLFSKQDLDKTGKVQIIIKT